MARKRNQEMDGDLLSGMAEISGYLRVSAPTVLKWVRELDLPCRKTQRDGGGMWISNKSALDEWSRNLCQAKVHKNI